MDIDKIEEKLQCILIELLGDDYQEVLNLESHLDDSILHVILNESSQALSFVIFIEEEFEIEFDDDEVDINFFLSFEKIVSLINKHKPIKHVES